MHWIWPYAGIAVILVWNGTGQNLVWLLLDFCRNLKPCKSAQERCRLPPAMRKQTNSERATLHMHFAQCTYITIKPIDLGSLRVILLKRSINCFSFDVEAGEHWWKAFGVKQQQSKLAPPLQFSRCLMDFLLIMIKTFTLWILIKARYHLPSSSSPLGLPQTKLVCNYI